MTNFKNVLADFEFNNDVSLDAYDLKNDDPCFLSSVIADEDYEELDKTELIEALKKHEAQDTKITKEELKKVFIELKDRILHPKGSFDKAGRFYLYDEELVNVRSPSTKYPYSQMTAGRTAKFVKAIAEKYKVQSIDELRALFK